MYQLNLFQEGYLDLIKRIQQKIKQAKNKLKTFISTRIKVSRGWEYKEIKFNIGGLNDETINIKNN